MAVSAAPMNKDGAPRYIVYARKSTDDHSRQLRSIEDQLAEVRAFAEREKLRIVQTVIERKSAKKPGRPEFNAMLDAIERGEASGIIAWHPDRLTRNPIDSGRIVYLLGLDKLKDLQFPTGSYPRNAQGKFMLNLMFSQSQYYIDNLSEHIRRGKYHRAMNGYWPQAAPIGYKNNKGYRTLVPDPQSAPLLRRMLELYATGDYSLTTLRDELLALGLTGSRVQGRPPSRSQIQIALENPFYYGIIRYKGHLINGKHEPLITQELFDKCRRVMKERERRKARGCQPFAYRGLFRCGECGGFITMEVQKGHRYLRCTKKRGKCHQRYIREEAVTEQAAESIRLASISPKLAEELLAELDTLAAEATRASETIKARLARELIEIQQRQELLLEAYTHRAITVEQLRDGNSKLAEIRFKTQRKLDEMASGSADPLEPIRTIVRASASNSSVAETGDPVKIAQTLKTIGSNHSLRDRRHQWEPQEAWQMIVDQAVVQMGETGAGSDQAGVGAQDRENRIKRRGGDSNPRYRPKSV